METYSSLKNGTIVAYCMNEIMKGTMCVSNSVFGVTQKERGVTIMFPYNIEDLDEEMTS
jgi:hypothetical protein